MKFLKSGMLAALLFTATHIVAQTTPTSDPVISRALRENGPKLNYVKLNLTSIAVKNFGLQYERVLTKRVSVALSGRWMPESNLPYRSFVISKFAGDDAESTDMINGLRISNYAVTPEVKLSLGKGYGEGFYISAFYRHANFDVTGMPIEYESDLGEERKLSVAGNLKSHTGGILFGVQKTVAKMIVLDFWLLGPHAGSGKGLLSGVPSAPLSADEQDEIREELEKMDIPFLKKTISVDANRVGVKLDGPWAGLRMGISAGIRF